MSMFKRRTVTAGVTIAMCLAVGCNADPQPEHATVSDALVVGYPDCLCPSFWLPLCGADGITYANQICLITCGTAESYPATPGECADGTCTDNVDCVAGEYCAKAAEDCGGVGICEAIPEVCPLLYEPVCGCDGQTHPNDCEAAMGGVNVAAPGKCPCTANTDCPAEEYCEKAVGDCTGQGTCEPVDCPPTYTWAPVCGCDGQTYANSCVAEYANVNVAYVGECMAGCASNADCAAGEYCHKAAGNCAGVGSCEPRPYYCPYLYAPVCGCNGVTYPNSCLAAMYLQSVDHDGGCW